MSLGYLQLIVAFSTEYITAFMVCQETDILNTILNFIALLTIAQIDNTYYTIMRSLLKNTMQRDTPRFLRRVTAWQNEEEFSQKFSQRERTL